MTIWEKQKKQKEKWNGRLISSRESDKWIISTAKLVLFRVSCCRFSLYRMIVDAENGFVFFFFKKKRKSLGKRSCVHIRRCEKEREDPTKASMLINDLAVLSALPPSTIRFFSTKLYQSMAFKIWKKKVLQGVVRQKKKEGCNWRWVNRWRRGRALYCPYSVCRLEMTLPYTVWQKIRFETGKKRRRRRGKKKSLIASIRSLYRMWYGQ